MLFWCGCFFGVFLYFHFRLALSTLLDFKHISFSASSHLHLAGEVERIVAFSCSCSAWIGSLCKAEVSGGSRAQHHCMHRVLLTGSFWPGGSTGCWDSACFPRVVWLNGPVVLLPASAAFQGILRKRIVKKKIQNCSRWLTAYRIQTPKARLKASARLTAINSKMSALFLLERFVTFPLTSLHHLFYWDCLLWKKIPTGKYYGEIWQQQRGSCLKWPEVMPGFPQCLHCPQHCIVAGGMCEWVLRHRSETRLRGSSRSCSPFSSSLEKLHQSKATGIKSY